MRKGIGPNKLGAPKGVGKMYNSPNKQLKEAVKKIDASLDANIQKSSMKPRAEKGSLQEFVNDGPAPFVRRGYENVKRAVKKVTGSTYGTSL